MKGSDLLRVVDQMQHEKHIKREVIFDSIEAALQMAAQKFYGEDAEIFINIDRDSGQIHARKGEEEIDPSVFDPAEFGRILAQMAKQVMIQKIREAESTEVFNVYNARKGELVHGTLQRHEGGAAIVGLGKSEAILPRGEQIPGETHHIGDRIKAVILDVKRSGQRVKIILSRTHADFVRRMFEQEIPEIQEKIIEIRAIAREAGYRTKIAVSSIDLKVDCVGACVGVRGSRIKNVVDELGGERIDIVRWNDSLQVLIPNALQPAQIEEVFLYPRLGRAIVLVKEDQLSLAIGRRGQNVRLASKLVGWDIEIMTLDELNQSIERAETWFNEIPYTSPEAVEALIEEGFLSYDDLTCVEGAELAEIMGLESEEQGEEVYAHAEEKAEEQGEEVRAPRMPADASRGANRPSEARTAFQQLFPETPAATEEAPAEGAPAGDIVVEGAEGAAPEGEVVPETAEEYAAIEALARTEGPAAELAEQAEVVETEPAAEEPAPEAPADEQQPATTPPEHGA
jgi:transcription termination/antitermination protein NusA